MSKLCQECKTELVTDKELCRQCLVEKHQEVVDTIVEEFTPEEMRELNAVYTHAKDKLLKEKDEEE